MSVVERTFEHMTATDLTVSNVADCAFALGVAPSLLLERLVGLQRLLGAIEDDARIDA